ncbi:MAG: sodium:proton exchanger [Actinobacteria bacterium]|nr:MAG: sodium:proton exchanger [Actinomycetota bacterium]
MSELSDFGLVVLVVAGGVMLALLASRLSERYPVPAPALFLLAALALPVALPHIKTVERIGVVAVILILFDGGMNIGWRRFRRAVVPIATLGIVGTLTTAVLVTVCAHFLLDLNWTLSGVLGAALAPTDPAVMFSILGNKELGGKTGTILEGEAGVNDPVGIALLIGMVDFATTDGASGWSVVQEFVLEMTIGLAVGIVGAGLLVVFMRRVRLPGEGLYPLRSLAAAGVIYGLAAVAHGSGFLAVFIAGLALSEIDVPHKRQIQRFHTTLASLAEIVVFVALGLTVSVGQLTDEGIWRDGLLLAIALAFLARPLGLAPLLWPLRLKIGEKLFLAWGGLKGAVPILLAAFVILADVHDARRLYEIVFVVVLFSVVVQGSTVPFVASRLGVPIRAAGR